MVNCFQFFLLTKLPTINWAMTVKKFCNVFVKKKAKRKDVSAFFKSFCKKQSYIRMTTEVWLMVYIS